MLVKIGKAAELLGVSIQQLRYQVNKGEIRCETSDSGTRYFDVVESDGRWYIKGEERKKISGESDVVCKGVIYTRVTNKSQTKYLNRQIEIAKEKYPDYKIVTDFASDFNWKRKGLSSILSDSKDGRIKEIVIADRSRLCRFSYDLLEEVFRINGTKLVVLEREERTEMEQFTENILALSRNYNGKIKGTWLYKNQDASDIETREDIETLDEECSIDL